MTTDMNTTDRIVRLREHIISTTPEVFADRARLVTTSYKHTNGKPPVIRRAEALSFVLDNMAISIAEDELIVGSYTEKPRGCQIYPEYDMKFIIDELDSFQSRGSDRFVVSDAAKAELREIYEYWKGNALADTALRLFPEECKKAASDIVYLLTPLRCGIGHMIIDYPACINEGVYAVIGRISSLKSRLDICAADYADKLVYYEAVITCLKALIRFSHRFAELARWQAAETADQDRARELTAIAENCSRVPQFPAQNFWQALQSFWLIHIALHLESSGHSVSPGRFDQYMYPYYKHDLDTACISPAQGRELLHCLWLKFFELNKVRDIVTSKAFSGYPMFQNLMVGGQDADGRCAVNELSYLCLDATAALRLPQPSLSARWFFGCPDEFLDEALRVIRLGTGLPALFNDEALIPNMLAMGYTLNEARDYAIVGCTETVGQGNVEPWLTGGFINALKPLEYVILGSDDEDMLQAGDMPESFEQLYGKYLHCMARHIRMLINCDNIMDTLHGRLCPTPLESAFTKGCLESGKTSLEGGAKYNSTTIEVVGLPNVVDSLAAIDTIIYRKQKLSWHTLKEALANNFAGYEDIRALLLNHAPKYGNDDEFADGIAQRYVKWLNAELQQYASPRGGKYRLALYSISSHILFADTTRASADGRAAGEPLADGGISCAHGRDISGLTALLNSVAAVDPARAPGSTLLNVRLAPGLFDGDGVHGIADAIKTYFLLKGQHIQCNVFDSKTLRDAQKHPENYPTLMVRVAGFSVFFTSIDAALQEDIIRRTEHASGG